LDFRIPGLTKFGNNYREMIEEQLIQKILWTNI